MNETSVPDPKSLRGRTGLASGQLSARSGLSCFVQVGSCTRVSGDGSAPTSQAIGRVLGVEKISVA